jgi:TonB family protein
MHQRHIALLAIVVSACALRGPSGSIDRRCASAAASAGAPADTTVYDTSAVDTRPAYVSGQAPSYPKELRETGVTGDVLVEFVVNADGLVAWSSVRVVEYSNREFADSAVVAIRTMRFCPATRHGVPVRVRIRQPVQFRLG